MSATPAQSLPFVKLEALGNDFMLLDARRQALTLPPERIRRWADRRRGVGFDQLLILGPGDHDHHASVEIRNADASPAEQCGNGMRAIALWLARHDRTAGPIHLNTAAGTVQVHYRSDSDISASLGVPDFSPQAVGLAGPAAFPWRSRIAGEDLTIHGASLGNPHLLVIEQTAPDAARLERLGRALGTHEALTGGANVSLATLESPRRVRLNVFERGAGATLACGSAAGAAAAILLRLGRVENPVEVAQPGGTLVVNWPGENRAVDTAGPARYVFEGVIPWPNQTG